jgi:transposase
VARDRAAPAKALRDGPAVGVADARDSQRHLLCHAGGLPVAAAPNDLPPWGTIYRWFASLRDHGCFERINHALMMANRERFGREATDGGNHRQSEREDHEGQWSGGFDAGKKVNGRKRHASLTPTGVASYSNRIREASKTAIVADRFCVSCGAYFRLSTTASALWTPAGASGQKHTLEEGRLCVRRFAFGGHNK